NDDPVLRSVVMTLQRQFSARLHHDALDLVALATVKGLVPAPRSVDAIVMQRQVLAVALEVIDHGFDRFSLIFRSDEHRVLHGDNHEVFDPHHGDAGMVAIGEAIVRVLYDNLAIALNHIAARVLLHEVPNSRPGPDVAPWRREGHASEVACLLRD